MKTRERRTRNGLPILKRVALEVDRENLLRYLVINGERYLPSHSQSGELIMLHKKGGSAHYALTEEIDRRGNRHWQCTCPWYRIHTRYCKHLLSCMAMGWIPGDWEKLLKSVFVTE